MADLCDPLQFFGRVFNEKNIQHCVFFSVEFYGIVIFLWGIFVAKGFSILF